MILGLVRFVIHSGRADAGIRLSAVRADGLDRIEG